MPYGETDLLTRRPWVTPRPLTVAKYHRMGEAGILTEDDRVELIEGQLIAMSPIDAVLEPALLPGVKIPVSDVIG